MIKQPKLRIHIFENNSINNCSSYFLQRNALTKVNYNEEVFLLTKDQFIESSNGNFIP